jgi:hypothetical protein
MVEAAHRDGILTPGSVLVESSSGNLGVALSMIAASKGLPVPLRDRLPPQPVDHSPTVLDALPTELTKRFEREGWLLTRNYNDDIGASVADAFGTEDRGAVESY